MIRDAYEGVFLDAEKQHRLNAVLSTLRGRWVIVVDSDEFVEVPYDDLPMTVRVLERLGATALYAPMLQRITADGSLDTPDVMDDPFRELPLCSEGLYRRMGVDAVVWKYPLFLNSDRTHVNAGNHLPPHHTATVVSRLRGVTHHFKWRRPVLARLGARARSAHAFRHESAAYLAYLEAHGRRLPIADAFTYSRAELFRRGSLRRAGWKAYAGLALETVARALPDGLHRHARRLAGRALGRRFPTPPRSGPPG